MQRTTLSSSSARLPFSAAYTSWPSSVRAATSSLRLTPLSSTTSTRPGSSPGGSSAAEGSIT